MLENTNCLFVHTWTYRGMYLSNPENLMLFLVDGSGFHPGEYGRVTIHDR
jgi:hypothetical protein